MNRISLLLIFSLISIPSPSKAGRGIRVIYAKDLNHQSGMLGAYKALVIGINKYQDPNIPDLDTAVSDTQTIAELIKKKYGFQVQMLLNQQASRKAIYNALRKLADTSKPDDSLLIYYAGHGDLDKVYNDGWWIPSDAIGGDPTTYLDNVQVQKTMRSTKARHVLLISDSCYAGTLFGQSRAMPKVIDDKFYLNLYNEKSRWGMTSGNKTPVMDDGDENHSIFASQLIKALRNNAKPFISTQEIYTQIAPIVANNSEQQPLCRPIRNTGDQGGEFIFVSTKVSTHSPPRLNINNVKKAFNQQPKRQPISQTLPKQEARIDLSQEPQGTPSNIKLMVLVEESYGGFDLKDLRLAEAEIINLLQSDGFAVIDNEHLKMANQNEQAKQALAGNLKAATALGTMFGAQYVLIGKAAAQNSGEVVQDSGFKTVSASLQVKTIQSQSGVIIGSAIKQAVAAHVSALTGATNAFKEVSQKVVKSHLIPKIMAADRKSRQQGQLIKVKVVGVTNIKNYQKLTQFFKNMPEVTDCQVEFWNKPSGYVAYDIRYLGMSENIFQKISEETVNWGLLEVDEFSPNKLDLALKSPP